MRILLICLLTLTVVLFRRSEYYPIGWPKDNYGHPIEIGDTLCYRTSIYDYYDGAPGEAIDTLRYMSFTIVYKLEEILACSIALSVDRHPDGSFTVDERGIGQCIRVNRADSFISVTSSDPLMLVGRADWNRRHIELYRPDGTVRFSGELYMTRIACMGKYNRYQPSPSGDDYGIKGQCFGRDGKVGELTDDPYSCM